MHATPRTLGRCVPPAGGKADAAPPVRRGVRGRRRERRNTGPKRSGPRGAPTPAARVTPEASRSDHVHHHYHRPRPSSTPEARPLLQAHPPARPDLARPAAGAAPRRRPGRHLRAGADPQRHGPRPDPAQARRHQLRRQVSTVGRRWSSPSKFATTATPANASSRGGSAPAFRSPTSTATSTAGFSHRSAPRSEALPGPSRSTRGWLLPTSWPLIAPSTPPRGSPWSYPSRTSVAGVRSALPSPATTSPRTKGSPRRATPGRLPPRLPSGRRGARARAVALHQFAVRLADIGRVRRARRRTETTHGTAPLLPKRWAEPVGQPGRQGAERGRGVGQGARSSASTVGVSASMIVPPSPASRSWPAGRARPANRRS